MTIEKEKTTLKCTCKFKFKYRFRDYNVQILITKRNPPKLEIVTVFLQILPEIINILLALETLIKNKSDPPVVKRCVVQNSLKLTTR